MIRPYLAAVILPLVLLLADARVVEPQRPRYKIEATPRQSVAATITYEIQTTKFTVTHWTAFLPEPPALPSQTNVTATGTPAGRVLDEKSRLARKVRMIEQSVADPVPGAKFPFRLDVGATLLARKLVPLNPTELPPPVPPLSRVETVYYLSRSPSIDFEDERFHKWLTAKNLVRKADEPAMEFAVRTLTTLRAAFGFLYEPSCGKTISQLCDRKTVDCGGLSYLFVGVMRANGVPARVLVGRLALPRGPGSAPSQPEYDRPHIRAEFYMTGVGWVPVDPADANTNKDKPVEAFIGNDPGDLLVLHLDVDLDLPFADIVRSYDALQLGPYFLASGHGAYDGVIGPTGWELKTSAARGR